MTKIKLAIVGGRDFTDTEQFNKIVADYIANLIDVDFVGHDNISNFISIVSGGAKGVDTMAENYANQNNIPIEIFLPDWDKYGSKAGLIRNTDIINESTHVLALPTSKSRGTWDSVNKAKKKHKIVTVINV